MAESNNVITKGMAGMVGDTIVFRQRAGKTIVSAAPKPTNKPSTEQQVQHRQKFQQAIIYGKKTLQNEATKAAYQAVAKEGESAFNVAVADMLHAPDIDTIDLSGYHGNPGDKILVKATDDFNITQVQVSIVNADGSVLESGDAEIGEDGITWTYSATGTNADLSGDKIVVKVSDLPGNLSQLDQVIANP